MNTFFIVLLTIASISYLLFRLYKSGRLGKRKAREDDFEDFNEKFMSNAGKKMGAVELVKVFHPETLSLLRSLLDAEGIETYVIESRWGGLYPLSTIPGMTESVITIFEADLDAGRRVVEDFLSQETSTGAAARAELLAR